jgi:predicted RNase H-like HicB family nuclease
MKYKVFIEESDEGFAVSVPGLPGCHSQGVSEAEALTNITDAIREYLEVVQYDGQYRARCWPDQRRIPSAPLNTSGRIRRRFVALLRRRRHAL